MRHKGEPEAVDFLTSFAILHNVDSESCEKPDGGTR